MRKFVFRGRQSPRLNQKIQGLQRPKAALQLCRRHPGHGRQQARCNSRSDDGCELKKGFVLLRQTIDSRRNDPLHGWRNLQRVPASLRGKSARIGLEDPAVDELPRKLLDEERDLAGVTKHVGLEIVEIGRHAD